MDREWVTPADEYVCRLSAETQRIAKEELREDPITRDQALAHMREWIKTNPRIVNCRLDSRFLLRFLRAKKFSCPLAQECLERYLLLRQSYGQVWKNLNYDDPRVDHVLELGGIFPVPQRDHMGRRVMVYRPGVFDAYKFNNEDICHIVGIMYETLMECEEDQVRGYVHFGDAAGVGFPHLTLFTPREAVRIVKNGERILPMRHKEVHGFNVLSTLKFAVDWGFTLVSEKIRKRIKVYTTLDKALENIDRKLLPKEYGGTIPMADMINLWREELKERRETLLANDKMEVRLEMYTEAAQVGAVSSLRKGLYCSRQSDLQGLAGSFRKLEVD